MFVGVFNTSSIDAFHVGEVDQRANYWFYGFASYSYHLFGILGVLGEFMVHSIIMFFVDTIVYFFELGAFATALFSQWTVFAIAFATSVGSFGVAFTIGFFAFEKEFGLVAFGFIALIIVFFFVEGKSFSLGFVLSKVWNVGIDILLV